MALCQGVGCSENAVAMVISRGEVWAALVQAEAPTLLLCLLGNPASLRPFFICQESGHLAAYCKEKTKGTDNLFIAWKRQPYFPATHVSLGAELQLLAFSKEGANREEGVRNWYDWRGSEMTGSPGQVAQLFILLERGPSPWQVCLESASSCVGSYAGKLSQVQVTVG